MTEPAAADWDAQRYHRVANPHAVWGANVLERLELRGDETVVDAGCGSGRVTAQLLERLPTGHVIAVDVSPAMLAEAQANLAQIPCERVRFVEANLVDIDKELQHNTADAVFSTATFHWIDDHERLFNALHAILKKPQGQLVAQFGGGDNLAEFMRATDTVAHQPAYAEHLNGKALWRFYYTPDQTTARLERAGFTGIDAWLEPSPQTFKDAHALADYARAIVLRNHLAVLPPHLHRQFEADVAHEIHARMGDWTLDYVRLNVAATAS